MCANCGCGYATYDDLETGAPKADALTYKAGAEAAEGSEAK